MKPILFEVNTLMRTLSGYSKFITAAFLVLNAASAFASGNNGFTKLNPDSKTADGSRVLGKPKHEVTVNNNIGKSAAACPAPAIVSSGSLSFCGGGSVSLTAVASGAATVSTLAGNGNLGALSGTGTSAVIQAPLAISTDESGNAYVSANNGYIYKITPAGVPTVFAGPISNGGNIVFATVRDNAGNFYYSDSECHCIKKISSAGVISTLTGATGRPYADGNISVAGFLTPGPITCDNQGNIFVVEKYNPRIRKITPAGNVTTIAGTGVAGFFDTPADHSRFASNIGGLAVGPDGTLYIADTYNNAIRKIDPSGSSVTTLTGSYSGNANGSLSAALFNKPTAMAIDASGNIYVCDNGTMVRKISTSGTVSTVAGNSVAAYAEGSAASARFGVINGIAIDPFGNLLVADYGNNRVRKIQQAADSYLWSSGATTQSINVNATGTFTVQTIIAGCTSDASTPVSISVSGSIPATPVVTSSGTLFNCTSGSVTLTSSAASGNVWSNGATTKTITVSATGKYSVVVVSGSCTSAQSNVVEAKFNVPLAKPVLNLSGPQILCANSSLTLTGPNDRVTVSTYAGSTIGFADGDRLTQAKFGQLRGITQDVAGNIYVADYANSGIRKITPAGIVSTISGTSRDWGYADGTLANARYYDVYDVAVNASGEVFVSECESQRIRKISGGLVSTLAGNGTAANADGIGTAARFNYPQGIDIDKSGNIYVADSYNSSIRKITPAGLVSTYAGNNINGSTGGIGAPAAVAINTEGSIFASDLLNKAIKLASKDGSLTNYVNYPGPRGVDVDEAGNVYFTTGQALIRYNTNGTYVIVAGSLTETGLVNGSGSVARFNGIFDVLIDASGTAYVTDFNNAQIRKITQDGPPIDGYLWSNGATTQSITVSTAGTYTLQTISQGCTSAPSDPIVVTIPNPVPTITALTPVTVCGNGTVILKSSSTTGNVWSNGATTQTITVNSSGFYSVFCQVSGCTSLASIGVTVTIGGPKKPITNTAGTITICSGGSAVLTGPSNGALVSTLFEDNNSYGMGGIYYHNDHYAYFTYSNSKIMKISPTGEISTVYTFPVGNYSLGSLVIDAAGNIFVADWHVPAKIHKVTPAGNYSIFAGGTNYSGDGQGTSAGFYRMGGLAMDPSGNIYTTDWALNEIRKITPGGFVSTFAGAGNAGNTDGPKASATFNLPMDIAIDASGTFYIAEAGNRTVRKISPSGIVSTLINPTYSALTANWKPSGITIDAVGNIFVADETRNRIVKINSGGAAVALAGSSSGAQGSSDGRNSDASFALPGILRSGPDNKLYMAEGFRITKITYSETVDKVIWNTGFEGNDLTVSYPGIYSCKTIIGSCTSQSSLPITVNTTPVPTTPEITSANTIICSGAPVTLTSSAATGNVWSNGATTKTISVSSAGTYTVKVVTGSCTSATSAGTIVTTGTIPGAAGAITGTATVTQGSNGNYSVATISNAITYSWTYSGTGMSVMGNGKSVGINFSPTATSGTLTVKGVSPCGNGTSATLAITVTPLSISSISLNTNQSISGIYQNVVITGTPTITLTGKLTVNGTITIPAGATLVTGCNIIAGSGSFILEPGANLVVCNSDGIASSGNTGAIQTVNRNFSTGGNYNFSGTVAQITGTGLPNPVNNLTINNTAGVSLSTRSGLTGTLTIQAGNFNLGSQSFIFRSTSNRTAFLAPVPSGSSFLNASSFTSQRWLDPSAVRGQGAYYWMGAPVVNQNVSVWNTYSNPYVPTTFYNTSGTQSSVWTYKNSDNTIPANGGWTTPFAPTFAVNPGLGVRVWFANSFFAQGALTEMTQSPVTGNVNLPVSYCSGTCAGNTGTNGWNFVANPYPATIDWNSASWTKTNIAGAIYIWRHKQSGYATYVNGVGTLGGSNLIASGQGFMVHATGASPVLTAREAIKSDLPVTLLRNSAISLARLKLQAAGLYDESVIVDRPGSSVAFSAEDDAHKFKNPELNIWNEPAPGSAEAITSAELSEVDSIPLKLKSSRGQIAQLMATDLSDLTNRYRLFIRDNITGALMPLRLSDTLSFTLQANEVYPLTLLVQPLEATGLKAGSSATLSLQPNPNNGAFSVYSNQELHDVQVTDILGKTVYSGTLTGKTCMLSLTIPSGVYTAKFRTETGMAVKRLVVE
ncbi:MAG: T9SS type A sorting domain-containing protein [Bacteroidota bacterium]